MISMDKASTGGFDTEKQRAIERMREMNSRSKYRQSAKAEHTVQKNSPKTGTDFNFLSNLGIPFLDNFSADSDLFLILGLALILMSENSDRLLLLALLYILL